MATEFYYTRTFLERIVEPYGCRIEAFEEEIGEPAIRLVLTNKDPYLNASFYYNDAQPNIDKWKSIMPILLAVGANGLKLNSSTIYTDELLLDDLKTMYVNPTPEEKLNTVLEYVRSKSNYDGHKVSLQLTSSLHALVMYFKNMEEWDFYIETAVEENYLIPYTVSYRPMYALSIKGLGKIIDILKGRESNICFIALAFTDEMKEVYNSVIRPTVVGQGYEPYIVDSDIIDSDRTINDAIIAGLKKAKFTIADFTSHRNGVYFEAGFALGRGQKVIYMCSKDDMQNSHFDLRNYQHIVWKDTEDLQVQLTDKIEAFIKD